MRCGQRLQAQDPAEGASAMAGPASAASVFTNEFSIEMFELLWGHERGVLPTAVDHAYEMIWKKLIAGQLARFLFKNRMASRSPSA